jgi:hypothetical protein
VGREGLEPHNLRIKVRSFAAALEETFDYWAHELPDYVLADDTARWRAELDEFERLLQQYPPSRDFEFELQFWRFHCDAWEEYQRREDEFDSYQAFIARRNA